MASTVAALAGATKMITKTPDESIGVPSKEINAYGIRTSKMVVNLLAHQTLPVSPQLETEEHFLAQEVHDLMKSVYNLGKGDLAQGVIHAFELGVLDVPFAPSRQNQNKVMPARDNDGCIRILEFGSLGLSEDIRAIHRQKLAERGRFEGRDVTFQMTIDDIYAVSNGMLIGRPNGGKKR
jgi:methylaspartate mutase epsilon subunit